MGEIENSSLVNITSGPVIRSYYRLRNDVIFDALKSKVFHLSQNYVHVIILDVFPVYPLMGATCRN